MPIPKWKGPKDLCKQAFEAVALHHLGTAIIIPQQSVRKGRALVHPYACRVRDLRDPPRCAISIPYRIQARPLGSPDNETWFEVSRDLDLQRHSAHRKISTSGRSTCFTLREGWTPRDNSGEECAGHIPHCTSTDNCTTLDMQRAKGDRQATKSHCPHFHGLRLDKTHGGSETKLLGLHTCHAIGHAAYGMSVV